MAQRVDYAFLPGVRDELLWPTVNKVLGHVRRTAMSPRDFRDWFKDAGLWQKDEAPALLDLLDVEQAPVVHLGPWAEQVLAAKDDAAARDLLYKRLCDENLLLVKYVLEALDVDGGGRLHSTSELHRMLTSYVYPGKHLGRVAFEAWIKWLVASGRVRLIGIRWGLTDLGKQAVPRLRTVDADEFLDDESAPPSLQPSDPVPAKASVALAGSAVRAAKIAIAADDEDLPDAPPEAEPVDLQTFAAYEAHLAQVPPVRTHPEQRTAKSELRQRAALETDEILTNLRAVAGQRDLAGGSLLAKHGLESKMAQADPAKYIFLAALLARTCLRPGGEALVELLRERAGGWEPVLLLLDRPEALVSSLVRWNLAGAEPAAIQLRALLLDAVLGGRALKAQAELPSRLAEAPTSEALFALLGQGLLQAASFSEQAWMIREMVKAGLWTRPSASSVAFVATRPVRLMAYRLRLLDSHFAPDLPTYLTVARRLTALMPAGSPEAAAFEALAPDDHLRFDCPHVPICSTACEESVRQQL